MSVYSFDGNLRDLARELWRRWGHDPLTFSKIILVLPSRRAVKTLQEELQAVGGSAVLLPYLYAATETDQTQLPFPVANPVKAIENVDRRLAIGAVAQQVLRRQNALGEGHALAIADSLLPIINELQLAEKDYIAIDELDIGFVSQHWQQNKDLLVEILQEWEQQELGLEPVRASQQFFDALGQGLLERQYSAPVLVVNVLNPALFFKRFLLNVHKLVDSYILLPAVVDKALTEVPKIHPDAMIRQMLSMLEQHDPLPFDSGESQINDWHGEVFRPADSIASWQQQRPVPGAENLRLLEASSLHQEALCIAVQMRQVVEIPEKTVALVTNNRSLADLVQQYLRRWELTANDAAGTPLVETPVGTLLCLLATLSRTLHPVTVLDVLKHPLCKLDNRAALELDNKTFRRQRVRFQQLTDLRRYLPPDSETIAVIETLADWLQPLQQARRQPLGRQLQALQKLADIISEGEAFKQEAGIAAQQLLQRLGSSTAMLEDFPATVQALLREANISPVWQAHQRLHIWGVQEAVMQPVDVLILGGMNQGTVPAPPAKNCWLNQPMQLACGLADAEQAIGLQARSVLSLWQHTEVLMTRSIVEGGAPTLPSPFLARLQAYLAQQQHPLAKEKTLPGLAQAVHRAPMVEPALRPNPAPPLAARPREYSVSNINTLQNDPYGYYAANILRLRVLDPLDQPPTAQERGKLLHAVLEDFLTEFPEDLPPDTTVLNGMIEQVLHDLRDDPLQQLFWQQKFTLAAAWVYEQEQQQRQEQRRPELLEHSAEQKFPIAPGEEVVIKAKADRVDINHDNTRIIIDYKTGAPPTVNKIQQGQELQLSLEAWLVEQGAFHNGKPQPVSQVEYWGLSGKRQEPGKKIECPIDTDFLVKTQTYVATLLAAYTLEGKAYSAAEPHQYDDYQQLKRASEWV